jgi:hypothetical protein
MVATLQKIGQIGKGTSAYHQTQTRQASLLCARYVIIVESWFNHLYTPQVVSSVVASTLGRLYTFVLLFSAPVYLHFLQSKSTSCCFFALAKKETLGPDSHLFTNITLYLRSSYNNIIQYGIVEIRINCHHCVHGNCCTS